MNVNIINSGSSGNCAVIDDLIVIDAGWNVTPPGKHVFITHHHSDHVKYLDNMRGMQMYALPQTIEKLQAKPQFLYTAFNVLTVDIPVVFHEGETLYHVVPIAVKHDVPCVSFIISKVGKDVNECIFFGNDFNSIVDEKYFIDPLRNKMFDAIYIEANNTLSLADFSDVYFSDDKPAKDSFHRTRSFQNHCNVDYLIYLFTKAGYNADNKFTEPVTLLHKSSYYYAFNPERVLELCKIAKIKNPIN